MTHDEYLRHQVEGLTDGVTVTHEDKCGQCHKQRIVGKCARRFLRWVPNRPDSLLKTFHEMADRVWRRSKYCKAYDQARAVGMTHESALKELERRGWYP